MKINAFERLFVNNPIRNRMLLRNIERIRDRTPGHPFESILEIGCGHGAGIRAIDRVLAPKNICAFDLDERMVDLARRKARGVKARLEIQAADAEHIPYPDGAFDTVFEFTIFHHIPDWRKAIAETARVLSPKGRFFFEELTRQFHFDVPVVSFFQRRFTVHPWETIPDRDTFLAAIEQAGFTEVKWEKYLLPGWILGSAVKPG